MASLRKVLVEREKEVDDLRAVQRDAEAHIRQLRDKAAQDQVNHMVDGCWF